MSATIHRLGRADVPAVVDVLSEAFHDYPVMRYVLGPGEDRYDERLRFLVGFFVMARVCRDEILLGIGDPSDLDAAALVSRPGSVASPELDGIRDLVWAELGADARDRYGAYGAAVATFEVGEPHIHLNMIGTRSRVRGAGLGGDLLRHVHELSARDETSAGVSLTTEHEPNVALYRHFGYEVIGEADISPRLHSWGFFRPDPK